MALGWLNPAGAEPPPLEAFAQLPAISNPVLSPNGRYIAYFRPVDGRRYLLVHELFSDGKPIAFPTFEELDYEWVRWANDDRLVFAMSYSGKRYLSETHETRLLSAHRNGQEVAILVRPAKREETGARIRTAEYPPAQIQDDVIDWLMHEPNHILVALDEDQDAEQEVRKIDVRNGDYVEYKEDRRGIQTWLTDRSNEVRIGYGFDRSDFIAVVRNDEGWQRAKRLDWWHDGWFPVAFTEDPTIAYVTGPNDAGRDVLRLLDINSGELGEVIYEHESFDVDDVLIDAYTGALVGVSYIDDYPRRHYLDDELAGMQASLDRVLPDTVNQMISYSADRRQVLVHSFSDVEPGVYRLWNRDESSLNFVAETMPGLKPDNLAETRPVTYAARDGWTIPAYVTRPRDAGDGPLPTVVLPHGGPNARDDRRFWFLSQFLASRGYAVLQPNFRGSTGYGRAFAQAGRNEWGGRMQDDVTDGVQWLIDEGIADPARICIVGWSYGGYAAAMGAVKTPDLYRCAASINGVLNLPRLIGDDKKYVGGRNWTRHMGLGDADARSVSPYHRAEDIRAPVLIIQARDDARVHEDQGKGMHKRLRRLKKPVEYVEVEHGGHSMDNEAARAVILTALERFLGAHLAND